jgi:AraC-like DNA-binding protein
VNRVVRNMASPDDGIRFTPYPPGGRLAPFVRNLWTVHSREECGTSKRQRIVPDGCIDIIFVRTNPTADYQASVVGTMTRPMFEALTSHVDYIGIRFAPGGFRHFFDTPPTELTDQIVSLDSLSISTGVGTQLAEANSVRTRLDLLEESLNRQLKPAARDSGIDCILSMIAACDGNVSIAELARRTGWSPRHLRRRFATSIGIGPKTFCQIVRFRKAFRILRRSVRPDSLEAALESGYYDQAHFIHEFGRFYGATPSTVACDPHLYF